MGDVNNATELFDAVEGAGVEILDHTQIMSLNENAVETTVFGQPVTMPYDVLVIAQGLRPNDHLAKELEGAAAEVFSVGNVVRDRTAFYAIHEGFTTAYYL